MKLKLTACFVIAVCSISLVMGITAYAQEAPSIDDYIKDLDKALTLNDDQEKKIRSVLEERQERFRDSGRQGSFRRGGGMLGFRSRADSDIEAVLTDAQVTKYREYQRNQSFDMRIASLDERLKLTDDQKKKIRAILAVEADKTEKLYADMPEDREARREYFQQFRDIRDATNTEIEKVLTKKQQEEHQKMQEELRERMRGGRRR